MPHSQYRVGGKGGDKPDFFIATPSFSGRPCSNYTIALADTAQWLGKKGKSFDYWLHAEDCHVDDCRNYLVKKFWDSGAPYLIFIDDDVGWDTKNFAKLILFQDADIVGGIYPLKQRVEDYPVRLLPDGSVEPRADGLVEVAGIPTGFMRISRKVIEKMLERKKHMAYMPKNPVEGDEPMHVIFERAMVDGNRWSGDLNFCREARELGFKVWCDPDMDFSHQGYNRWEGNLGLFLRKKQGLLDPKLDDAMHKLMSGDDSLEVFEQMFISYAKHHSAYCAGPRQLKEFYHACKDAKGPILETGSGLTTLVGGIAVQKNGHMVHAIEHDIEWWRQVRHFIKLWQIKGVALHYCPLKEYDEHLPSEIPGDVYPYVWYDYEEDELPEKFDVFLLDGPQRRFGREGVFRQLLDRIKDATVWIADDMDEPAQLDLVKKYVEQTGRDFEVIGRPGSDVRRVGISRKPKNDWTEEAVFSAA